MTNKDVLDDKRKRYVKTLKIQSVCPSWVCVFLEIVY